MKKSIKHVLLGAALFSAVAAQAGTTSLSLTPDLGAGIAFTAGGTFQFTTDPSQATLGGGYQWFADNFSHLPSPTEYIGKIDGTFQIGAITGTALSQYESAPVTSTGPGVGGVAQVTIMDGSGGYLTGAINFGSINTGAPGYSTTLGVEGTLVVSHITYSGSADDLSNFVLNGSGSMTVQFQYNPGVDLITLKANGGAPTSYGGSLSTPVVVPETSSVVAGFGAIGLVVMMLGGQIRRSRSAQASR
jgi:hypothetical protein